VVRRAQQAQHAIPSLIDKHTKLGVGGVERTPSKNAKDLELQITA
jgi:hypothetical protein